MSNVQRGVIKAPNQTAPGNHVHSSQNRTSEAPGTHSPNDRSKAPIGSSSGMGRMASPVNPPNASQRFKVEDAKMPQPPSAVAVGKGDIPVNPFNSKGMPNSSVPMRDSARRPK